MKKLPQKTRLDYWKYQYAALSFEEASKVAMFLIENSKPPLLYQPLFYPLLTSLVVLYMRSFGRPSSVRISDDLVPSEFTDLHDYLHVLRDKVFAHVDKNAPSDWDVKHLSKIFFGYHDGAFRPAFGQFFRDGFQIDRFKELCDTLHKICHSKSEEILEEAMDGTKHLDPILTFEIDISEGDKYLLKLRDL